MSEITRESWPKDLPKQLRYRLGEKPLHHYLQQNARDLPKQTAYNYYGREISWLQLEDYTNRVAAYLADRGVKKGDPVALFMQNCPQYLIGHYAAQKLGAMVVPLNPMYKEAELEYLINEAGIKAVVCAEELFPLLLAVREKTPSVEFYITTNYRDFLPDKPDLPLPPELKREKQNFSQGEDILDIMANTQPISKTADIDLWNDVGLLVFTSGTTGRPKAAMLTFGNALFKTAASVHANGIKSVDRSLAVAPLCHIAGMVMGVNAPVYMACETWLLTRFDPEAVITAIEQSNITTWYSIAPMNVAILNYPGIESRDLSSLNNNMATSFGAQVNQQLAAAWDSLTKGCALYEAAYGLSETHTCDTFMPRDNVKFGSCGIATYDTEIRIVDLETNVDLPQGKQGQILVKNPGVFKGYLNRPEATADTLKDGWVCTGDIGVLDEDDYLYFVGRVKEMIKCSGYSVFPEDVEALMNQHPAVLQSAVIGVPDEKRGESVKAFVVLHPERQEDITEEELVQWAKGHMASYKYPRYVQFCEKLPATSSGKVLRRLLKEQEEEQKQA